MPEEKCARKKMTELKVGEFKSSELLGNDIHSCVWFSHKPVQCAFSRKKKMKKPCLWEVSQLQLDFLPRPRKLGFDEGL